MLDTFFCNQFGGPPLKTYDFKLLRAKSVADKPPGLEPPPCRDQGLQQKSAIHFCSTLFFALNSADPPLKTYDFKVLLDLYCPRPSKGQEDALTNLLTDLNLIVRTDHKSNGEVVYELNNAAHQSISTRLFAGMMFTAFEETLSVSFDNSFDLIGLALGMTREEFMERLDSVCLEFPEHFVFKEDAGLKVVQCAGYRSKESFCFQPESQEAC